MSRKDRPKSPTLAQDTLQMGADIVDYRHQTRFGYINRGYNIAEKIYDEINAGRHLTDIVEDIIFDDGYDFVVGKVMAVGIGAIPAIGLGCAVIIGRQLPTLEDFREQQKPLLGKRYQQALELESKPGRDVDFVNAAFWDSSECNAEKEVSIMIFKGISDAYDWTKQKTKQIWQTRHDISPEDREFASKIVSSSELTKVLKKIEMNDVFGSTSKQEILVQQLEAAWKKDYNEAKQSNQASTAQPLSSTSLAPQQTAKLQDEKSVRNFIDTELEQGKNLIKKLEPSIERMSREAKKIQLSVNPKQPNLTLSPNVMRFCNQAAKIIYGHVQQYRQEASSLRHVKQGIIAQIRQCDMQAHFFLDGLNIDLNPGYFLEKNMSITSIGNHLNRVITASSLYKMKHDLRLYKRAKAAIEYLEKGHSRIQHAIDSDKNKIESLILQQGRLKNDLELVQPNAIFHIAQSIVGVGLFLFPPTTIAGGAVAIAGTMIGECQYHYQNQKQRKLMETQAKAGEISNQIFDKEGSIQSHLRDKRENEQQQLLQQAIMHDNISALTIPEQRAELVGKYSAVVEGQAQIEKDIIDFEKKKNKLSQNRGQALQKVYQRFYNFSGDIYLDHSKGQPRYYFTEKPKNNHYKHGPIRLFSHENVDGEDRYYLSNSLTSQVRQYDQQITEVTEKVGKLKEVDKEAAKMELAQCKTNLATFDAITPTIAYQKSKQESFSSLHEDEQSHLIAIEANNNAIRNAYGLYVQEVNFERNAYSNMIGGMGNVFRNASRLLPHYHLEIPAQGFDAANYAYKAVNSYHDLSQGRKQFAEYLKQNNNNYQAAVEAFGVANYASFIINPMIGIVAFSLQTVATLNDVYKEINKGYGFYLLASKPSFQARYAKCYVCINKQPVELFYYQEAENIRPINIDNPDKFKNEMVRLMIGKTYKFLTIQEAKTLIELNGGYLPSSAYSELQLHTKTILDTFKGSINNLRQELGTQFEYLDRAINRGFSFLGAGINQILRKLEQIAHGDIAMPLIESQLQEINLHLKDNMNYQYEEKRRARIEDLEIKLLRSNSAEALCNLLRQTKLSLEHSIKSNNTFIQRFQEEKSLQSYKCFFNEKIIENHWVYLPSLVFFYHFTLLHNTRYISNLPDFELLFKSGKQIVDLTTTDAATNSYLTLFKSKSDNGYSKLLEEINLMPIVATNTNRILEFIQTLVKFEWIELFLERILAQYQEFYNQLELQTRQSILQYEADVASQLPQPVDGIEITRTSEETQTSAPEFKEIEEYKPRKKVRLQSINVNVGAFFNKIISCTPTLSIFVEPNYYPKIFKNDGMGNLIQADPSHPLQFKSGYYRYNRERGQHRRPPNYYYGYIYWVDTSEIVMLNHVFGGVREAVGIGQAVFPAYRQFSLISFTTTEVNIGYYRQPDKESVLGRVPITPNSNVPTRKLYDLQNYFHYRPEFDKFIINLVTVFSVNSHASEANRLINSPIIIPEEKSIDCMSVRHAHKTQSILKLPKSVIDIFTEACKVKLDEYFKNQDSIRVSQNFQVRYSTSITRLNKIQLRLNYGYIDSSCNNHYRSVLFSTIAAFDPALIFVKLNSFSTQIMMSGNHHKAEINHSFPNNFMVQTGAINQLSTMLTDCAKDTRKKIKALKEKIYQNIKQHDHLTHYLFFYLYEFGLEHKFFPIIQLMSIKPTHAVNLHIIQKKYYDRPMEENPTLFQKKIIETDRAELNYFIKTNKCIYNGIFESSSLRESFNIFFQTNASYYFAAVGLILLSSDIHYESICRLLSENFALLHPHFIELFYKDKDAWTLMWTLRQSISEIKSILKKVQDNIGQRSEQKKLLELTLTKQDQALLTTSSILYKDLLALKTSIAQLSPLILSASRQYEVTDTLDFPKRYKDFSYREITGYLYSLFFFFKEKANAISMGTNSEDTYSPNFSTAGVLTGSNMIAETRGDNNCIFHASLGCYDQRSMQIVCSNAAEKRNQLADAIVTCNSDSSYYEYITAGIKELIFNDEYWEEFVDISVKQQLADLRNSYHEFRDNNQLWGVFFEQLHQNEYKEIIQHINQYSNLNSECKFKDHFWDVYNRGNSKVKNTESEYLQHYIQAHDNLSNAFEQASSGQMMHFWKMNIKPKHFRAFAQFVRKDGQWLIGEMLGAIAIINSITIVYYPGDNSNPSIYNPGKKKQVYIEYIPRHYQQISQLRNSSDLALLASKLIESKAEGGITKNTLSSNLVATSLFHGKTSAIKRLTQKKQITKSIHSYIFDFFKHVFTQYPNTSSIFALLVACLVYKLVNQQFQTPNLIEDQTDVNIIRPST